jgi:hypothetical protein
MAFSAVEQTRITTELMTDLAENCPTVRQTFLDGSDTYANNLTALNTLVAAVTAALFNVTAPTILP